MRPLRALVGTVCALGLVAVVLASLILSRESGLSAAPAPTSEDVAAVSALLGRRGEDMADGTLEMSVSAGEIDAARAVLARLLPDFELEIALATGRMDIAAAAPVTVPGGRFVVPLRLGVPDFDGGPRLSSVRLGALPLPAGPTLGLLRAAGARALGPDDVDRIFRLADRLSVTADGVTLASAPADGLPPDPPGAGEIVPQALGVLRGAPLPGGPAIAAHQRALEQAISDGTLPRDGSALPHLRFMLDRTAQAASETDPAEALTAAILALTRACGSEHIRPAIAGLVPDGAALDALPLGESPCGAAGLHDRVDQRRHFVTAAALRLLSRRAPAIAVGELKELSDMAQPGNGFDPTDLVANQSGIRLADAFLAAPAGTWPALIARIETEADVIAALDGIPGELPRRSFETVYGGLGTPAYDALMAGIEARIDALPLHGSGARN